ncbi:MFS transporter [Guyparkeria sp. SCN-R1]|uniref:AmpG family muropeptide MFS transporter n=1 Tax=Guyparkeria sp. SCN-R1 TaxID=2341113 RepID=UPI000F64F25E|nr:MFS transporter [Guyparkeria sp. SCN-R1]RRQ20326.1 MFS transporter [Guyparkeria sp. SCN-R1]
MSTRLQRMHAVATSPKQLAVLFLGFASGLPLLLTSGTLQAWLTMEDIDLKTIGLFALVGLPYTLKFLWAPILDRFAVGQFARRRGWILLTQVLIAVGLLGLAISDAQTQIWQIAIFALMVAFLSATQDIAIDAWRTDTLDAPERGLGAAVFVMAYRIGMLVAGSAALVMGDHIGWPLTYTIMAALMGVGMVTAWFAPEKDTRDLAPQTMREAVVGPMKAFFSRPEAWALIFLVILYKFGDAFAGTLTTAFLIRGAGFTATDVGLINNGAGLIATIIGGLFGGLWMVKLGLFRALMLFGVLQAITNLGYAWLYEWNSYGLMVAVVSLENFAGGLGTAAFVAFLMALCDKEYSATQYALLSAIAALGRIYLGPTAGFIVEAVDWTIFFILTFLAALPGLWLLWRARHTIRRLDQ